MILRARADSLELDAGETGWSLICETEEGDTIVLNIHGCAFEFARSNGLGELLRWNMEGAGARLAAVLRDAGWPDLAAETDLLG